MLCPWHHRVEKLPFAVNFPAMFSQVLSRDQFTVPIECNNWAILSRRASSSAASSCFRCRARIGRNLKQLRRGHATQEAMIVQLGTGDDVALRGIEGFTLI
jgi:hypothetical protein